MVVMGFDFGYKRIGMAVGQSVTQTASPLPVLSARDGVPQWSILQAAVQRWQPQILVVGYPLNMDDSKQQVTYAAKRFANKLREKTGLKVELVDERLSTIEARSRLFEQGGYAQLAGHKAVDSHAAVVITEQYLLGLG